MISSFLVSQNHFISYLVYFKLRYIPHSVMIVIPSIAFGKKGIVATQHPYATLVGIKVLEENDNAFDASIAISAMLSVVLPQTSGIGGDAFVMIHLNNGEIKIINGSGYSPKELTIDKMKHLGYNKMPIRGPYTITIPGLVSVWEKLSSTYGQMDLQKLLRPAISIARNGFPISHGLSESIRRSLKDLIEFKEWRRIFTREGQGLKPGDILIQEDLACILEYIAKKGCREFYEGKIAEEVTEELRKKGAPISLEDFKEYEPVWDKPLRSSYKDWELFEIPPNSQGLLTLLMLNLLELQRTSELDYYSAERITRCLNSAKILNKVRDLYIADPRFYKAPITRLLSKEYAEKMLEGKINEDYKKTLSTDGDTTFFVVGDSKGNIVSFIQSIFFPFGSGIVSRGIVFQNRGHGFSLNIHSPNKLEPRKRPLHTLSILLAKRDKETLVIGCAGGYLRPQIHVEVFTNVVDYNMDLAKAVEAPRFMLLSENEVIAEESLYERIKDIHDYKVRSLKYPSPSLGIVQALLYNGRIYLGVADARGDGVALTPL